MKSRWRQGTDYQGMGSHSLDGTQGTGPIGLQKLRTDSLGLAEGGSALATRDAVRSGHNRKLHSEWWAQFHFTYWWQCWRQNRSLEKVALKSTFIY